MRILHEQTLDKKRQDKIYQIVSQIYNNAIDTAKNTTDLQYFHMLPELRSLELKKGHPAYEIPLLEFYKTNMSEILAGIQSLFHDCSVKNTVFATTRDGKKYDTSKIDENLKPFIQGQNREYIVIDWS